jgi:hypothetical protein
VTREAILENEVLVNLLLDADLRGVHAVDLLHHVLRLRLPGDVFDLLGHELVAHAGVLVAGAHRCQAVGQWRRIGLGLLLGGLQHEHGRQILLLH